MATAVLQAPIVFETPPAQVQQLPQLGLGPLLSSAASSNGGSSSSNGNGLGISPVAMSMMRSAQANNKSPLSMASTLQSDASTSDTISRSVARPSQDLPDRSNTSLPGFEKKMHQTSTRIMKVTPDGRPFARDFNDLYATLIVSLQLKTHRSRFRNYPHSFTTEEAAINLSNLKFAQSNRMPDPSDASRIVTTTTTTTFSMARDMAKALCQRFMDARFIECANDKSLETFKDKAIWQLTPKGICKVGRFVQLNGINAEALSNQLLQPARNTMNILSLERHPDTDMILRDKSCIEIAFRKFAGKRPNVKSAGDKSDVDAAQFYGESTSGVKIMEVRRSGEQTVRWSFSGRSAINWLMECTSVLDMDEAHDLADLFIAAGLIGYVFDSRGRYNANLESFRNSRHAIYNMTVKGRRLAGWETGQSALQGSSFGGSAHRGDGSVFSGSTRPNMGGVPRGSSFSGKGNGSMRDVASPTDAGTLNDGSSGRGGGGTRSSTPQLSNSILPAAATTSPTGPAAAPSTIGGTTNTSATVTAAAAQSRETNTDRLNAILNDPGLRSQFREFLADNFCEENLSFYLAVGEFVRQVKSARGLGEVSEGLARAYSIYNAYLAAGSPCELNLDHALRQDMAACMTSGVDDARGNQGMIDTLAKVVELYDRAQAQVFRLMATDSVAKFVRTPLYLDVVGEDV